MLERPWYKKLNYPLIFSALALSVYGLFIIQSATLHVGGAHSDTKHQLAFLIVGALAMIVLAFLDYHLWQRLAWPLYILNLIMLGAVAVAGHSALGAQRWIGFGPIVFQPSEPAKLLTTLTVAAVLANPKRSYTRLRDLIIPVIAVAIPTALVIKQPDLGTALVLIVILTVMLFFALPNIGHFLLYAAGLSATAAFAVASPYFLKGYQRQRLLVFLNPHHDPQGSGWSLIQAKIAVGSGGLTGKGLYNGTQTQLGFVPEHATDFIFTVVGEELGFLGALALLGLYALLLGMGMLVVIAARDKYGLYVSAGIVAMFAFHVLVNVGMTLGIMPITGIPLPFISYGGSSLITSLMCVGVLLNIHLQRDKISFDMP
jgi:rod shape determining protein RodA